MWSRSSPLLNFLKRQYTPGGPVRPERTGCLRRPAIGQDLIFWGCCEQLSVEELILGFPRFPGQVGKGHAMTIRLSIDDQSHQNQTPVYGAAEG